MTAQAFQNRFSYQARDQRGQVVSGFISALTMNEATKALRAEGKYIVDIKPARHGATTEDPTGALNAPIIVGRNTSIKREELIYFTLQLSVMVDTGVPLSDALQSLSEQTFSDPCVAVLKSVVHDVTGGKDFSSTLEQYPRVFPKYYVSLVRASEISGTMGPMLRKLADYLVAQRETTKKVKGALIYPGFMFVMSIGVTLFLLTEVLPKFTAIFASRKAALPMPTQVLMAISGSLLGYWYLWVLAVGTMGTSATLFFRTETGQRCADYIKLHVPIFGPMFHKLYLSRALSTMGTMISSGVQMLDSLTIVKEVAGNSYYRELWEEVRVKVQNGAQLSEPLLKSTLVPKSVSQMISSGEKTGELPNVLNRISAYMEEDLRTAIKTATQFIEPVMIGVMGILIGGVAIAMLMPILTISRVMAEALAIAAAMARGPGEGRRNLASERKTPNKRRRDDTLMPMRFYARVFGIAFWCVLCAGPAPAQGPAPAADTQPTLDAASADLVGFLSQRAALKDDDVNGRVTLARWAAGREMWPQAAEMAHEALDRDPDSRPAWTILQQIDEAIELPAEPHTEELLKAEFQRRFNREFKTRNARHFLICYDTSDAFAAQRGGLLEKAYNAFMFSFNMRKLRPEFLERRLVVILFKNRDDYLAYARQTEGADLSWAAGYYSQRTNRTAFYDDSSGLAADGVQQVLDELRAKIKDYNAQIRKADATNQSGLSNQLAVERNRMVEQLGQINARVGNAVAVINNVKTYHEAAHQLAFNTGVQKRLVDYPLWFTEGLACSFEVDDRNFHRGPNVDNGPRAGVMKAAIKDGKFIPLEELISAPPPPKMNEETLNLFYAEGWSLFHYLYHTNREGMEKFLLAYKELPMLRLVSPTDRMKFFTDAFGDDLPTLQSRFVAYMKELPGRMP